MKWKPRIGILISLIYLVVIVGCAHTPKHKPSSTQPQKPYVVKPKEAVSAYGFIWPVEGEVLSFFGERSGRIHQGIDIAAKKGTKIYAAMSGKVIYSDNELGRYGNMIIIEHKKGFSTVYAHNAKNLVRKGKQVKRGQVIALVGQTGNATGPHLHFEIRKGKEPVNPLLYLP
ncbi:MAG: M23 family metallopeptidase [bacterium]|nr:M23 family metallopeptidase [bacterium]